MQKGLFVAITNWWKTIQKKKKKTDEKHLLCIYLV